MYSTLYSYLYTKGGNMAKKIKSFTVDEDIYNSLVNKFKENKVDASVSLYLNNCLKNLLMYLEFIERKLSRGNYTVPMSFVIKEMVQNPHIFIPGEGHEPEDANFIVQMTMEEWQNDYDADQQGIPRDVYKYVREGAGFVLSANKRYVIDPRTGEKFIPINGVLHGIEESGE